jgi:polysaccharide pyruvyl transferase WcaK-like protein
VRESSSIDYVKDNSLWNGYCQRTSDLAFGYYTSKDRENTNDINASNLHKKKKFIIVPSFMTPLGMKKSEMNLLNVNICRSVVNSTGLMPIVLSNTKQDDDPAITLYNSIRDLDGVEIILSNESIDNVANIIDNSQFMICNRFHAMVISSRIGVPFLGLVSYSPEKFKGILGEDLEMGDYLIDISNMRFDDIILNVQKKLSELTIGMNEVSIRLQKASNNAQHELVKNIGKILSICQMPENHG